MSPAAGQTDKGLVLGIETSTSHGSVALFEGGLLKAELLLYSPGSHSEKLFPSIERLMELAGITSGDLGAVAVSMGPGSFTGLRVGVAAAKGLAFSLQVPLYGVPTLGALADAAPPGAVAVCAVLDARRGEVFAALFRSVDGRLEIQGEAAVLAPDALSLTLEPGTLVVGELSGDLRARLAASAPVPLFFSPPGLGHPRAAAVAARGAGMLGEGLPTQVDTLLPLYVRPSDAEANVARKALRRKGKGKLTQDNLIH